MRYFAYGSNMCTARLAARVSVQHCLGPARLQDYALYCDKRGADNSGKFTIAAASARQVQGVVFELADNARSILDRFEGPGYHSQQVSLINSDNGTCEALTYIAHDDWRDSQLQPFDWYLAFTLAGALEHQLPRDHIEQLRRWPCQTDPLAERVALNRDILAGTSADLSLEKGWLG